MSKDNFHLLLKPAPGQSISRILQSLTVAHTWRQHRRHGPRPRLAGPLPIPGRPGRRPPARRSEVHRGQPGAGRDGGRWSNIPGRATAAMAPGMPIPSWTRSRNGSSSVALSPERRARWRRKVRGKQPAKELDGVRSSVRSGRPYGAEDWVEVISHRLGIVREPRRRGRPPREKMPCRVGKGHPAGSIELRVSPSPSKIPYGGFSPVRLQMDRQWRPSTTSRGLSAVHIRPMRPSYTPPQLQLPGIRDPRRDYPFENLSVQCGTTPNN